jgi:conjugative transfer region protein TrbK
MNLSPTFAVLTLTLALAACGKPNASSRGAATPTADLQRATDRCAHGGMDATNDPTCQHVRDQNFEKFMRKDPGR